MYLTCMLLILYIFKSTLGLQLTELIDLVQEKDIDFPGKYQNETYFINMRDIHYIESVDNLTFLYTGELIESSHSCSLSITFFIVSRK